MFDNEQPRRETGHTLSRRAFGAVTMGAGIIAATAANAADLPGGDGRGALASEAPPVTPWMTICWSPPDV